MKEFELTEEQKEFLKQVKENESENKKLLKEVDKCKEKK